jgi:hypothetical protein
MEPLRKIPLEMLINILEDLYNGGADYVDISGDIDTNGVPRDTIKITVKPEYLSPDLDEEEEVIDHGMDFLIDNTGDLPPSPLSDDDIEDLI